MPSYHQTPTSSTYDAKGAEPRRSNMLDQLLSEAGHDTRLHVIIETNEGLEAAYEIAHSSKRMDAMFFGAIDMAPELRCDMAWEPLLYARSGGSAVPLVLA